MSIKALSILIPTYNDTCRQLVDGLRQQAEAAELTYEIIVGDDGSTDGEVVAENRQIAQWPHCRYLTQSQNTGRAAIRNFLVRKAQYDYLLFIDSDMTLTDSGYLGRYLMEDSVAVVDGGVVICGDAEALKGNLRYRYEKEAEEDHTAQKRQQNPYRDFHTANFLIRRELMLAYPFDERFRYYGYEDVLFGKQLRAARIAIRHIDNPLGFSTFERNPDFVAKTEEGLRTLYTFREELRGYSRLLTLVEGIHLEAVRSAIRLGYRLTGALVRRNLCGRHPSLAAFSFYKLGYYVSLI